MSREARNPVFRKRDEKKRGKKRKGKEANGERSVQSVFRWISMATLLREIPGYIRTFERGFGLVVTSAPKKLPLSKKKERKTSQMERRERRG